MKTQPETPAEIIAERIGIPRSQWGAQQPDGIPDTKTTMQIVAPAVVAAYRSFYPFDGDRKYADIASDAMADAVMSYDPNRGTPITTWVWRCVRSKLISGYHHAERRKFARPMSLDDTVSFIAADHRTVGDGHPQAHAEYMDMVEIIAHVAADMREKMLAKNRQVEADWIGHCAHSLVTDCVRPSPQEFLVSVGSDVKPNRLSKVASILCEEISNSLEARQA